MLDVRSAHDEYVDRSSGIAVGKSRVRVAFNPAADDVDQSFHDLLEVPLRLSVDVVRAKHAVLPQAVPDVAGAVDPLRTRLVGWIVVELYDRELRGVVLYEADVEVEMEIRIVFSVVVPELTHGLKEVADELRAKRGRVELHARERCDQLFEVCSDEAPVGHLSKAGGRDGHWQGRVHDELGVAADRSVSRVPETLDHHHRELRPSRGGDDRHDLALGRERILAVRVLL